MRIPVEGFCNDMGKSFYKFSWYIRNQDNIKRSEVEWLLPGTPKLLVTDIILIVD